MADDWMTTEQAAGRLGVKPETLYAYVSRGLLRSERTPGERRSRYARADVERLAARQRAGGRAGALEILVESELTMIDLEGRFYYRGWDVEDAAREASFEEVAAWLWTARRDTLAFDAPAPLVAAAKRAMRGLGDLPAIDRLRSVLPAMRSADPLRNDRRPDAVARVGRGIVATFVEALPPLQDVSKDRSTTNRSLAAALWPRLTHVPAKRADVRVLDAALVLLADHELAASTLAARVAASTWADPYLVVQAGLAALGGPLHGGASEAARALLREVDEQGRSPEEVIGARLRDGQLIPGFGHRVYRQRDPRAGALLDLQGARRGGGRVQKALDVLATMRSLDLPPANVDFATALFTHTHEMIDGAGEVIFAIARTVGWLAHAIEEYEHRLRFRPRAVYVGSRPPGRVGP